MMMRNLLLLTFVCLTLVNCVEISVIKQNAPESVGQDNVTTTTQLPTSTAVTTEIAGNVTVKPDNVTTVSGSNETTISTTVLPSTTTVSISTTSDVPTSTEVPVMLNPFSGYINRRAENKVSNYHCNCDFQVRRQRFQKLSTLNLVSFDAFSCLTDKRM